MLGLLAVSEGLHLRRIPRCLASETPLVIHKRLKTLMPFVYILRCADGSLYTGIAKDVARRLAEHAAGRASRYTRVRLPVALAWCRRVRTWRRALQEEYRIKNLPRAGKLVIIRTTRQPATRADRRARRGKE